MLYTLFLGIRFHSFSIIIFRFVSTIHEPSFLENSLLSGGGDPYIYEWDLINAKLRTKIDLINLLTESKQSFNSETVHVRKITSSSNPIHRYVAVLLEKYVICVIST